MEDKDGGNAFPFFNERVMNTPEWGMTLRDYFAAEAIQLVGIKHNGDLGTYENTAAKAYRLADAMLSERLK